MEVGEYDAEGPSYILVTTRRVLSSHSSSGEHSCYPTTSSGSQAGKKGETSVINVCLVFRARRRASLK